jgi:mannose-6-phosphate isomerase-like protein (cupin superfamily)
MMEENIADNAFARIALSGDEKEEVLKKCRMTVSRWGLRLPRVEPSPLHFGLNDFYNTGEIEFDIVNDVQNCYCGKFIFMFRGQKCPEHYHRLKKETFFVVKGKIGMTIDSTETIMKKGDSVTVERGQKHEFVALSDSLILESSNPDLLFDSIFSDPKIRKAILGKTNKERMEIDVGHLGSEMRKSGICSVYGALVSDADSASAGIESGETKPRRRTRRAG